MAIPETAHLVDRELREIFGPRLQSLIVYGAPSGEHATPGAHGHTEVPTRTMAVVERMTREDLRACAGRVAGWHAHGLATPLLVAAHEFDRSLDAFPLEFGAILADHVVVSGANPFAASRLDPADVRRACEVQARSHLLHPRRGHYRHRPTDRRPRVADRRCRTSVRAVPRCRREARVVRRRLGEAMNR